MQKRKKGLPILGSPFPVPFGIGSGGGSLVAGSGGGGGGGGGGGFLLGLGLGAALLALDGGLLGVRDLLQRGAGLEAQGLEDDLGVLGAVGGGDHGQLAVLAHGDDLAHGLDQKLLGGLLDLLDLDLGGLDGGDGEATGGEGGGDVLGGEGVEDGVGGGGVGVHLDLLEFRCFCFEGLSLSHD